MGAFFGSRIQYASLEKGKTAVSLGENVIINNVFVVLYDTFVGAEDGRAAPCQRTNMSVIKQQLRAVSICRRNCLLCYTRPRPKINYIRKIWDQWF